MFKKISILFLILSFVCFNILNIQVLNIVLAAWIDFYWQKLSSDISATFSNPTDNLSVEPDQYFRFEAYLRNNEASPITNISYYTNFPTSIVYSWWLRAFTYDWIAFSSSIPITSFNPPTTIPNYINWLSSLAAWSVYSMKRVLLKFPLDHSVYANNLSSYFTADNWLTSITRHSTVYVNVKPHITNYFFSKSSIVWNGVDSTDLIVKVKDFNWCSNMNNWIVRVNLTNLWLSSSETLIYDSCDNDWKTAIFKKTWITTLASVWDKTFTPSMFTAVDEDGNISNDPAKANATFDIIEKTGNYVLNVATPNAPVITLETPTLTKVSNILPYNSSNISFSSTQTWTYKIALWSCDNAVLNSWNYDTIWANIDYNLDSSLLSNWDNNIFVCVTNINWDVWSANTTITKDTTPPIISNMWLLPWAVVENDSTASIFCSEDWYYKFEVWSNNTSYNPTTKDIKNEATIINSWLNIWNNAVTAYCKDSVWNESTTTINLIKESLPPAMTSSWLTLVDNDSDWDWVDWRDLKVTWDTSVWLSYPSFESYRIYILPENTSFTWTFVWTVYDKNIGTWTGTSSLIKDSLWNPLAWWNYIAYVTIMWTSLNIWTPASATWTLVSDVVPHPSVLSAKFTTKTNLSVKFDTPLKEWTSNHFATWFVYQVWWNTFTWLTINSISNDTINVWISDLWNTYSTWILSIATWAVWGVPVDGSYNYSSWNILISDYTLPEITFSTWTLSSHNWFYSWSLDFNYTTSEDLQWWNTRIEFQRVWWNIDTIKYYYITDSLKLSSGSKSINIDLNTLPLVSWSYYDVKLVAVDKAWNISNSTPINIKFDNTWPWIPNITPIWPNKVIWVLAPNFVWLSVSDDSWNWSWVKWYKLRVFNWSSVYWTWNSCTWSYTDYDHTDLVTLTKSLTLVNQNNYAWWIFAYDNMWNVWQLSNCDNFYIDTNIPSFSLWSITDTVLNSISYTKWWNNLVIKSTITNTNSWNIYLNASSLKDSSYSNISCSNPVVAWVTCSYSWNIATYTFPSWALVSLSSGVKQVQFTAANISGINTWTYLVSTTLDNQAPTISNVNLSWSIFGWTNLPVYFNLATDNIWINYLKFEYSSDWWTLWNNIWTWTNTSPYNWNITSIPSWANYKLRVTAYDMVWNSLSAESWVFSIDKVAPTVPSNTLTYPSNAWIKLKWWSNVNILWNSWSITDTWWLVDKPITLYYSIDGWNNYIQIATNLANNWTYNWTVPAWLNNSNLKIKLEALDNVWNKSSDVSDNNFEVDSTLPIINISYAWLGWSTPQTNNYINNSWFDISAVINDTNLSWWNVYYSLYNQTAWNYFNWTIFTWSTENWNLLWTSTWAIYNLSSIVASGSSIINWNYYKLKLKASDVVWNSLTTSQITYIWDIISPTINITNSSWSYFSWSINISWTSSDSWAWISSVKISIKKWASYWNWTTWVGTEQILATNTSNNYANWNYNFTAPGSENDWQNYEVIVYAYDKSYKVNNTSSGTINIILDKTGPVIESDVFTYTSTWFYGGWDNFNLTWNPAKITSSWAWFSHLKLEYNHAWNIVLIWNNLPNNWSYSFTLPEINGNIRPLITAYDTIGNASNIASWSLIQVDSTPPIITSIETKWDISGNISWVIVRLSEEIKNPSILHIEAIFSSSTWSFSNSYTHTTQDNKTVLELKFSTPISGTHLTPTISWNGNIIEDLAGKKLASWNMLSIDKAQPVVLSAEIFDINNNGKLDKIEVVFSENLSSTTDALAWNLNNAFEGLSINSVSVSNNKVNIILNEWTQFKTDTWNMSLNFTSNSNYKDSLDNIAHSKSNIALIDKVKPVLVSKKILDTNNNFQADKIELTFSESLSWTLTWFSVNSWSLSNSSLVWSLISFDISWISWTNPNINISYSGSLEDSVWNILDDFSNINLDEKISPELQTATTLDQNGNGKIDGILLNFSEDLSWSLADLVVNVNGYVTSWYAMDGSQNIIVSVDEKQVYDTDTTPSVSIVSNSALKDVNNNVVLSQNINSQDGVWPVIIGARYEPSKSKIYMNFSETINNDDFTVSNFVLQNAWSYNTESVNIWEKSLTLSGETINYSTSTVSFATNSVRDTLWNKQTNNHYVSITAPIIINEIMVSDIEDNNYIELHNLSNDVISLSWWTIAWITIPNINIWANWYYLISKSDIITSIINVTPDLVENIDLSGSEIILNNGTIDIDKASLITGLWDISIPASIERKSPVSNWLLNSSWYTALTSTWFDNSVPLWTPWVANVFDTTSPTLSSNLTNNLLLPIWYYNLFYTYSDYILINTWSISFDLKKWNGSSFVNTSWYATGTIDYNNANFSLSWLEYGRYKTIFSISDSAWNISIDTKEFYVDNFSFTISTGSINLWILEPNNLKLANTLVNVEVKTIWAWFEISHHYDKNNLWDWDGNKWFGACLWNNCTTLEKYKNNVFVNQAGELQSSWELKTYNYTVKYGSLVDGVKPAWLYQVENKYRIGVNY